MSALLRCVTRVVVAAAAVGPILPVVIAFVAFATPAADEERAGPDAAAEPLAGVAPTRGRRTLRVDPRNPRYFTDDLGEPIYLTGSHTWNNVVDMDAVRPPRPFDFGAYLDFLEAHGHTYVRLWTWEVPSPRSERYERRTFARPQAWPRTGPGLALDGLPRFDVEKLDPEYFERLRKRAELAVRRGFYVSVMLFEGWAVQFAPGRDSHPFNLPNNVNGIDCGHHLHEVHTLRHPRITELQQRYVRAVVDAVNHLDGLMYEVCNECGGYSTDWQVHMMEYVRAYEATKGRLHPVGITYQWEGGTNRTLFESSADWIAPGGDAGHYRSDPEPATGRKVIIADTDHLWGSSATSRELVWKSFTRGLNTAFMDRYVPPDALTDRRNPKAMYARIAMGDTALLARHVDLRALVPRPDIASTGYALASQDEIVVYAPGEGGLTVDLSDSPSDFDAEWLDPATGRVVSDSRVEGGQSRWFSPPCSPDCVLYLRSADSGRPPLANRQQDFRALRVRAASYLAPSERASLAVSAVLRRLFLSRGVPGVGLAMICGFALGGASVGLLMLVRHAVARHTRD